MLILLEFSKIEAIHRQLQTQLMRGCTVPICWLSCNAAPQELYIGPHMGKATQNAASVVTDHQILVADSLLCYKDPKWIKDRSTGTKKQARAAGRSQSMPPAGNNTPVKVSKIMKVKYTWRLRRVVG